MKSILAWAGLVVAALASATSAIAAPKIYFGEDQNPQGAVTEVPVTARNSFQSNLTGAGNEGFETQTPNLESGQATATFAGSGSSVITATLQGGDFGVVNATGDPPGSGRFNTTPNGTKWWLASTAFTISFDTPISAFGFYGTDIGDFNGRVTVDLLDENDRTTMQTVNNTINGPNGSLLFWGFIDPTVKYKRITFGNTATGFDGFGFDDMVVGDLGQIKPPNGVPEPASLALAGMALLLGMLTTTRRRARAR